MRRAPRLLLSLSLAVLLASAFGADPAAALMARAATAFPGTLSADQRPKAQFAFDAAERIHWATTCTRCGATSQVTSAAISFASTCSTITSSAATATSPRSSCV